MYLTSKFNGNLYVLCGYFTTIEHFISTNIKCHPFDDIVGNIGEIVKIVVIMLVHI